MSAGKRDLDLLTRCREQLEWVSEAGPGLGLSRPPGMLGLGFALAVPAVPAVLGAAL